jgi:HTH-type transcriptional regulator, sugar sensing transcriptional regulator
MEWKSLKPYGLDQYEAKAYLALIELGTSKASSISSASKVPSGKIYPTLESLKNKGFITMMKDRPKLFSAVQPEMALIEKVKKRQEELDSLNDATDAIIASLKTTTKKSSMNLEKIQIVYGFKNYIDVSTRLHNATKKYWFSVSRMPISKSHLDSYRNSIGKGVDIRLLVSLKEKGRDLAIWKDIGVKMRDAGFIPTTFSVMDGTDVLIRICEDIGSKDFLAIWIKDSSLAKSMSDHFNQLWKTAKRI